MPVIAVVGNDAGWTQIAREQGLEPLAGLRAPNDDPAARHPTEVVGVGGLTALEHHEVRGIHHVVDGSHARGNEAVGQPAR